MNIHDTVTQIKEAVSKAACTLEEELAENKRQGKIKLDICKQCENFNHTTKFCGVCHCFMPAKTRIPGLHCPIEKW